MTEYSKRVAFTMGGKGGVGKTGVVVALAEWFQTNEIPVTLLDLDTENKARGLLKHFFNGTVTKVNIHTPAGLDAFVDHLDGSTPIILADMGAGAGQVAADWFESMYDDVAATGDRTEGQQCPTALIPQASAATQLRILLKGHTRRKIDRLLQKLSHGQ
jgi:MinD-like ATPase involved in chromosome partitioning or flagellar assembly